MTDAPMSQIIKILACAVAITAAWLWGNYRWHSGFAAGADTVLCLVATEGNGPDVQTEPSCQRISGRTVPYFPERLRPQGPPAEIAR